MHDFYEQGSPGVKTTLTFNDFDQLMGNRQRALFGIDFHGMLLLFWEVKLYRIRQPSRRQAPFTHPEGVGIEVSWAAVYFLRDVVAGTMNECNINET